MPEIKINDTTSVVTDKSAGKSGLAKIVPALINEDFDKIGNTLVKDILIPAAKSTMFNLVTNFAHLLFYGEGSGNYNPTVGATASGYHNSFQNQNNKPTNSHVDTGDSFIFTSTEIASRGDAEKVLYRLGRALDEYAYVTVANLYSICDEIAPYSYEGYGWRSLSGASIGMEPGGRYYVRLPRPTVVRK